MLDAQTFLPENEASVTTSAVFILCPTFPLFWPALGVHVQQELNAETTTLYAEEENSRSSKPLHSVTLASRSCSSLNM